MNLKIIKTIIKLNVIKAHFLKMSLLIGSLILFGISCNNPQQQTANESPVVVAEITETDIFLIEERSYDEIGLTLMAESELESVNPK